MATGAAQELKVLIQLVTEQSASLKNTLSDLRELHGVLKNADAQSLTNLDNTLETAGKKAGDAAEQAKGVGINAESSVLAMEKLATGVNSLIRGLKFLAGGFLAIGFVRFLKDLADTAARTEVLATVMHVVGNNAGYTNQELDKVDRAIQKLGITAQASRESLAKLLQAGISLDLAPKLARAAQDLAVISGQDSSQTFARMIINIQQLDTVGLRWMGILVSREQAELKYAQAIGKSVGALTQQQKVLAFANETLAQAAKLSGTYEQAMGDVGKQLTSMPRYFEKIKEGLGNFLLPAYSALVKQLQVFLEYMGLTLESMSENSEVARRFAGWVREVATVIRYVAITLVEHRNLILGVAIAYFSLKTAVAAVKFVDWALASKGLAAFIAWLGKLIVSLYMTTAAYKAAEAAQVQWAARQGMVTTGMGAQTLAAETLTAKLAAMQVKITGLLAGWLGLAAAFATPIVAYIYYAKKSLEPKAVAAAEKAGTIGAGGGTGVEAFGQESEWEKMTPEEQAAQKAEQETEKIVATRQLAEAEATASLLKTKVFLMKEAYKKQEEYTRDGTKVTKESLEETEKASAEAETTRAKAETEYNKLAEEDKTLPEILAKERSLVTVKGVLSQSERDIQAMMDVHAKLLGKFKFMQGKAVSSDFSEAMGYVNTMLESFESRPKAKTAAKAAIEDLQKIVPKATDDLKKMQQAINDEKVGMNLTDYLKVLAKIMDKSKEARPVIEALVKAMASMAVAELATGEVGIETIKESARRVTTEYSLKLYQEQATKYREIAAEQVKILRTQIQDIENSGQAATPQGQKDIKERQLQIKELLKWQQESILADRVSAINRDNYARQFPAPIITRDKGLLKAQQQLATDRLQLEMETFKAVNQTRQVLDKQLYDNGKISLQQYWRNRIEMTREEGVKEIEIASNSLKNLQEDYKRFGYALPPEQAAAQRAQIAKAQGELYKLQGFKPEQIGPVADIEQYKLMLQNRGGLQSKTEQQETQLRVQSEQELKTVQRQQVDLLQETATYYGGLNEVLAQINTKYQRMHETLKGVEGAEETIQRARHMEEFKARLEEDNKQLENRLMLERAEIDLSKAQLDSEQKLGRITSYEAQTKSNELIYKRITATKEEMAGKLLAMATVQREIELQRENTQSTDAQELALKKLRAEYLALEGQVIQFETEIDSFGKQLERTFSDSLGKAIGDTIKDARNGLQALVNFGQAIRDQIVNTFSKEMADRITRRIVQATKDAQGHTIFDRVFKVLGLEGNSKPDGSTKAKALWVQDVNAEQFAKQATPEQVRKEGEAFLKGQFTLDKNKEVPGTGKTVGELEKIGWKPEEIKAGIINARVVPGTDTTVGELRQEKMSDAEIIQLAVDAVAEVQVKEAEKARAAREGEKAVPTLIDRTATATEKTAENTARLVKLAEAGKPAEGGVTVKGQVYHAETVASNIPGHIPLPGEAGATPAGSVAAPSVNVEGGQAPRVETIASEIPGYIPVPGEAGAAGAAALSSVTVAGSKEAEKVDREKIASSLLDRTAASTEKTAVLSDRTAATTDRTATATDRTATSTEKTAVLSDRTATATDHTATATGHTAISTEKTADNTSRLVDSTAKLVELASAKPAAGVAAPGAAVAVPGVTPVAPGATVKVEGGKTPQVETVPSEIPGHIPVPGEASPAVAAPAVMVAVGKETESVRAEQEREKVVSSLTERTATSSEQTAENISTEKTVVDRAATATEKLATSTEKTATSSEKTATTAEKTALSTEKTALSTEKTAAGVDRAATSTEKTATASEKTADNTARLLELAKGGPGPAVAHPPVAGGQVPRVETVPSEIPGVIPLPGEKGEAGGVIINGQVYRAPEPTAYEAPNEIPLPGAPGAGGEAGGVTINGQVYRAETTTYEAPNEIPLAVPKEQATREAANKWAENTIGFAKQAFATIREVGKGDVAGMVRDIAGMFRSALNIFGGGGGSLGSFLKVFATGGLISGEGTGTSDSIPIMASNGEHITNAKETKQNLPLLTLINSGAIHTLQGAREAVTQIMRTTKDVLKFAAGGEVGALNFALPAFAMGGVVGEVLGSTEAVQSIALEPVIPRRYAGGGVVVTDAGAAAVQPGGGGPKNMLVQLHPDALNMSMREWLEHEVARQYGER